MIKAKALGHIFRYLRDQKPFLTICQSIILLKTLPLNLLTRESPKVYYPTDIAIWFDVGIEITDDILIRCRHYKNDTERISIFRVFFNPAFAFDEIIRLNKVYTFLL